MDVRKTLPRWLSTGAVVLASLGLAGGALAQTTLKICHISSVEDEVHKGALVIQEFVQSASNGLS